MIRVTLILLFDRENGGRVSRGLSRVAGSGGAATWCPHGSGSQPVCPTSSHSQLTCHPATALWLDLDQVPRGPAFTERLSQGSEGLTDQHPLYEGTHAAGGQEAGTPVQGLGWETRPDQLSCKGHCQGHPCMWEAF